MRGGRGGRPAAPATVRVYLSMVRALARDLGREAQAAEVRVPRHEPGPPETLTDVDYGNLLRVPDRRTIAGKRDYALSGSSGIAGCARPSCAACGPATCAARAQMPATTDSTVSVQLPDYVLPGGVLQDFLHGGRSYVACG